MTSPKETVDRLDYWKLIDRVACSGKVSDSAVKVLMHLLQHRNTKTGQCNPGIKLLASGLYPNLTPASGYHKIERALNELRENWLVKWASIR